MNDRQGGKGGQVAPFNPNPRWPQGYFQVLEELGRDARVMEPEDLKREVMDELAAARDGYC